MAIKVIKPGLATTVQDAGRVGYYNVGIPLSGALDQYSFVVANLLVGNDETAAVLECTLMGPELEFQHDAVIAVAGANRVLFGTDSSFFPRGWHHAIFEEQAKALYEIGTSEADARSIFGENLLRILAV